MSHRKALPSLLASSSLLVLSLPAQAGQPAFRDATGFYESPAQSFADPSTPSRGGWGLDYRGMSNHDPRVSRVHRLSSQERASYRAKGASPDALGRDYLNHYALQLGIESDKDAGLFLLAAHTLSDGAQILQYGQRVGGIEVFGPQLSLLIDATGQLRTVSGALHNQLRVDAPLQARSAAQGGFGRSDRQVAADVLSEHTGKPISLAGWSEQSTPTREAGGYHRYALSAQATRAGVDQDLRTRALYVPTAEGLEPAYYVEFSQSAAGGHGDGAYFVVARARDSRVLFQKSLTHHEAFRYRVWAHDDARNTPADSPFVDFTPHPDGVPNQSKPELPEATRLVTMEGFNTNPDGKPDPWLPAGATESSGNNVDAYTDRDHIRVSGGADKNNGFNEGDVRASVSEPGAFDRVYNVNEEPNVTKGQMMAAVTQIFYTTNWLHDYWYDLGWDEKSGNAQVSNYGRGGLEGDPLLAEAQDGADDGQRNNASMTPYPDGRSPIMQMYVWETPDKVRDLIPNPELAEFENITGTATYGPQTFDVTAQVVLVEDIEEPVNDGCQAPKDPDKVSGKIVLVQTGYVPGEDEPTPTCMSIQRAGELQKAGAVGMIFMSDNHIVPNLGGDYPEEITIPALSVSNADGERILAQLAEGSLEMRMRRTDAPDVDGSIDNHVVAHEWGHYAHLRLVRCAGNPCFGMSEGWADYFALHMTMREGDSFDRVYPLSFFASSGRPGDPSYFGLRRYPYSTNKKVNPLMFNHIAASAKLPSADEIPRQFSTQPNQEVHNAGEVWAQVLMDVEQELHKANAAKDKPLSWDEVHRLMGEYLIAGMKMAPPVPTWTEQRDAILAVAFARDKDHFNAMARGFTQRGMGTCAVSPDVASPDNEGTVANEDITGKFEFRAWTMDDTQHTCDADGFLDVDERGNLNVTMRNVGMALLDATTVEVVSKDPALVVEATGPVPVTAMEVTQEQTLAIPVRLTKAPAGRTIELEITLRDDKSCLKTFTVAVKPRANIDLVPEGTTIERFETDKSPWTLAKLHDFPQETWSWIPEVVNDEGNFMWHGRDLAGKSDAVLVSPPIQVSKDKDFAIEFEHAYAFEADDKPNPDTGVLVNWDGAVIEYSIDAGKTWLDVSQSVDDPKYTGVIGNIKDSPNNLKDRKGYVGQSPNFPERSKVKLNFGRKVAGETLQLRFRIGTDEFEGAPGWFVDNLSVQGADNKPFTDVVKDACDKPGDEPGDTGGDTGGGTGTGTGGGGDDPSQTPGGGSGGSGGCGCTSADAQGVPWWALIGLAPLGLVRRRRTWHS